MVLRVKELRVAAGMTQSSLAAEMGVNQPTVSNWEAEVCLPKARELPRLAKVLGCTISELYAQDENTA